MSSPCSESERGNRLRFSHKNVYLPHRQTYKYTLDHRMKWRWEPDLVHWLDNLQWWIRVNQCLAQIGKNLEYGQSSLVMGVILFAVHLQILGMNPECLQSFVRHILNFVHQDYNRNFEIDFQKSVNCLITVFGGWGCQCGGDHNFFPTPPPLPPISASGTGGYI